MDFVIEADIWETKANNVGLKMVDTKYATIVQDDMLIKQRNWDKTLIDILENMIYLRLVGEQVMNSILKREI